MWKGFDISGHPFLLICFHNDKLTYNTCEVLVLFTESMWDSRDKTLLARMCECGCVFNLSEPIETINISPREPLKTWHRHATHTRACTHVVVALCWWQDTMCHYSPSPLFPFCAIFSASFASLICQGILFFFSRADCTTVMSHFQHVEDGGNLFKRSQEESREKLDAFLSILNGGDLL